jgi:hypothetical protein
MKRGLVPRSSYVRALIDSALSDGQPAIAHRLQFHEDDVESRPKLMEETPARKITVVPDKHLCRFEKGGQVGWEKGAKVYEYKCRCGETKVRS